MGAFRGSHFLYARVRARLNVYPYLSSTALLAPRPRWMRDGHGLGCELPQVPAFGRFTVRAAHDPFK